MKDVQIKKYSLDEQGTLTFTARVKLEDATQEERMELAIAKTDGNGISLTIDSNEGSGCVAGN